jgi:ADP-ribose pyrophosphatase YjhB (NUDIX family)
MSHRESLVPERRSARLLIVDPDGRLLLFRYDDGRVPPFWATPGGLLLEGETYEAAAARELVEETGFAAPVGALVRTRDEVFEAGDLGPARWIERYYLVRAAGGTPDRRGWTAEEQRTIRTVRWWSLAELRAADEPVRPAWLPDTLTSLLADAEERPSAG